MIKKYFFNKFAFLSILFGIFVGVVYFNKKSPIIQKVIPQNIPEESCNVNFVASLLTKQSFNSIFHGSNYFWNRDVRNRYKAIKIDIKNESEHNLVLDKNSVGLILTDPVIIQKKLTSRFNFIPFLASGAVSALCSFGFGLATLPTMLASGAAGTFAGLVNFDKSEEKLGQNIRERSFDPVSAILIPKRTTISRILFVENKNLKSNFAIKLFNLNLEKYLNFNVNINYR